MNRKFILITMLALFAAALLPVRALAQEPQPTPTPRVVVSDNDVNRVAKKLYCPVCPNTPLDVCETQACKDWRAQIRDQLGSGWSDQQVIDTFVSSYGERVLAEPERGGFTSLVWTLPLLAVLFGLLLVGLIFRSWRAGRRKTPVPSNPQGVRVPISSEVLAKIEAEIRKVD